MAGAELLLHFNFAHLPFMANSGLSINHESKKYVASRYKSAPVNIRTGYCRTIAGHFFVVNYFHVLQMLLPLTLKWDIWCVWSRLFALLEKLGWMKANQRSFFKTIRMLSS